MEFCTKFGHGVIMTSILFVTLLYLAMFPNSLSVPSRPQFCELQMIVLFPLAVP